MAQTIEVFEFVINAFVALAGLVFCAALCTRENRQKIHILAAVFTGMVSLGTLARTLFWVSNQPAWIWLAYLFFSVFPMAGLLFFEELSYQRPRTFVKIGFLSISSLLVLSLIAFPAIAAHDHAGFLIALATSHALTVTTGLVLLWKGARAPETPARLRSILWAVWGFLLLTIPLLSVDWLNSFGFRTPRLGPVAILMLIHILFRVFNARGNFCLRTEIVHLGSTLFGLFFFSGILWSIENSREANSFFVIAFLALLCQLPVNFMRHYWLRIRSVGQPSTIERLNRINRLPTLAGFAEGLKSFDEIVKATWIHPEMIKKLELGWSAGSSVDSSPYVSLSELESKIRTQAVNSIEQNRLEFQRHLLLTTGGTSLIKISDERGYLSIQFSAFMQESYYRELGILLSSIAALQPFARNYTTPEFAASNSLSLGATR